MPSPLTLAAAALLLMLLSVAELVAVWHAFRGSRWASGGISLLFGVTLFALAALAGTVVVATRGYRALTEEDLAATVTTEPLPHQHFRATIILPGGRLAMYDLSGDAFYVDGYIVKWHPLVNILGLHAAYELDRVAGRYNDVADERAKPHTVYSLSRPKLFTMFGLVKKWPLLTPLVDAEYGSATFTAAGRPATFNVLVSTTGLLIRPVAP
jgi:hypothetical protein